MIPKKSTGLLALVVLILGVAAREPSAFAFGPRPAFADVSAPKELSRDFASAHELMLKGETRSAAALYESLLDRGATHPDVYFNLGNAYARSERWVQAVIAYERALRLDPTAVDVKTNLRSVRGRLDPNHSAKLDAPADHSVVDLIEPWLAPISRRAAATALVAAHALVVLALLIFRKGRRLLGATLGATALLGTGLAASATAGHYLMQQDPRAVILEASTLRKGPDARFESTTEVSAGARVRILNTQGRWHEVQKTDGTAGWLAAPKLERL